MGYISHPHDAPGGPQRDDADHGRLRHARDRQAGFVVGRYLQPAPLLFTRDGHNVFLGDTLRGGHAFLVCSGPSLASQDLSLLGQRGIVTCAVNNAATVVRPNYWVSVDDPGNFSDVIWRDPGILKLVPLCHMEKPFSVRDARGELVPSQELVGDMPGVFGFRRNEAFVAEQFLYEDTVNWGNHGERTDAYGFRGCRSVMLAAMRLLFYLGVRTLYLLGCDFRMRHGAQNYAFEQDRSRSSVGNNNHTFEALNVRFQHLLPIFEREGLRVYNCTPNSGLNAFEYLAYERAIEQTLEQFPKRVITAGMYDRKQREKQQAPQPIANSVVVRSQEELLPATTLVSAVDAQTVGLLPHTWQTWMRFHPWLAKLPAVVLYEESMAVDRLRKEMLAQCANLQFIPWRPDNSRQGRDRWSLAWLKFPAERVETPWYLKLEPEALATQDVQWLWPEWFQPDGQGRTSAWVAPVWGYSKPADVLQQLDEWGDSAAVLADFPRLNAPFAPADGRIRHEAISSWMFLGNTAWIKEIAALVPGDRLPCASHDTFVAYCAARRRERVIRWPFKDHGWNHSFRGHEQIPARCRALLEMREAPESRAAGV